MRFVIYNVLIMM